jgi:cellulose synthase/poly-beta-1,6-N-acetylglucosamine synthase-like glycosyltransferase
VIDCAAVAEAAFWLSAALVVYAYAVYPLGIRLLAWCFGSPPCSANVTMNDLPRVSLLIAAHNEAKLIESRLQNALELDHPRDKLEIVVASDGSTDGTADIVRRFRSKGVRLLDYGQRRGKAAVLNAAFPELTGEIVLLSDANTFVETSAARALIQAFAQADVGVVCGRLVLTDPATGRNVDSLYWKFETFIKRSEGLLGALPGANGGLYALRKQLFQSIPEDTIVDDLVIPLLARLRSGCRIVYESRAVAYEETPAHIHSEFARRCRIGAGGFQAMQRLWRLLAPRHGWAAFTFLSHKICRWLCPFALIVMLATGLLLWDQPFYRHSLLAQLCFYVVSVLAGFLPSGTKALRPLRLTTMFTSMNAALLLGFWRWLRGTQRGTWKRTTRLLPAESPAV